MPFVPRRSQVDTVFDTARELLSFFVGAAALHHTMLIIRLSRQLLFISYDWAAVSASPVRFVLGVCSQNMTAIHNELE